MSNEPLAKNTDVPDAAEPVRRRGDRRKSVQAVAFERRKRDRRDTPGVTALFRTLFRRPDAGL